MHAATLDIAALTFDPDDVPEPDALAEAASYHPLLVEVTPSGRYEVLDGFHRLAGLHAAGALRVRAIVVDDEDLAAAVSEPGARQQVAISAIYDAVGYDPLMPHLSRGLWEVTEVTNG